jgi:hypothetical protein
VAVAVVMEEIILITNTIKSNHFLVKKEKPVTQLTKTKTSKLVAVEEEVQDILAEVVVMVAATVTTVKTEIKTLVELVVLMQHLVLIVQHHTQEVKVVMQDKMVKMQLVVVHLAVQEYQLTDGI